MTEAVSRAPWPAPGRPSAAHSGADSRLRANADAAPAGGEVASVISVADGSVGWYDAAAGRVRLVCERVAQTARLMVGVPDYNTYVVHRQTNHPGQPIMTYQEFFRERQDARYAVGKGRFKACC